MPINKPISEDSDAAPFVNTDLVPMVQGVDPLETNVKSTWLFFKTQIALFFAHLNGSNLIDNASGAAFVSGSFTGTIQPTTLTASRAYTLPDGSGNVVVDGAAYTFSQTQTFAQRPVLNPQGTSSGDGGGLQFKELVANGSNYVVIRAPDAIGTNYNITLPAAQGGAGTTLTNDSAGNLSWQVAGSVFGPVGTNPGDGGRVSLQELTANGTNVVRIIAPDSIATDRNLFVPDSDGIIATQEFVILNNLLNLFN